MVTEADLPKALADLMDITYKVDKKGSSYVITKLASNKRTASLGLLAVVAVGSATVYVQKDHKKEIENAKREMKEEVRRANEEARRANEEAQRANERVSRLEGQQSKTKCQVQ